METESNKPSWPYIFGTVGASMFALGMLLVLAAFAPSRMGTNLGRVGFMLAGTGSFLLGVTWSKLLRAGQSGIGQVLACFAFPVSLIFLATRSGYHFEELQTAVVVLCLSLCALALAHAFTPRLKAVRAAAVVSLLGLLPMTLGVTGKVNMGGADNLLMMIGLGGLGAVGILLAVGMGTLRRAAEDPYQL